MKSLLLMLTTLVLWHPSFALNEARAPSVLLTLPKSIAYAEESSQKIRLRIMPLGDSITFGTPNPSYGGYRRQLGMLLTNDGYTFDFVGSRQSGNGVLPDPENEGHPRWTIQQIKEGIDSGGWLESYRPDIILLHIGTNDISHGQAAAAPAKLATLLDDILARLPRTHVIVAQIIPFRRGADRLHQSCNDAIANIAASKGSRVSKVDMQNILLQEITRTGFIPMPAATTRWRAPGNLQYTQQSLVLSSTPMLSRRMAP